MRCTLWAIRILKTAPPHTLQPRALNGEQLPGPEQQLPCYHGNITESVGKLFQVFKAKDLASSLLFFSRPLGIHSSKLDTKIQVPH